MVLKNDTAVALHLQALILAPQPDQFLILCLDQSYWGGLSGFDIDSSDHSRRAVSVRSKFLATRWDPLATGPNLIDRVSLELCCKLPSFPRRQARLQVYYRAR
jgi:hypothetical protein